MTITKTNTNTSVYGGRKPEILTKGMREECQMLIASVDFAFICRKPPARKENKAKTVRIDIQGQDDKMVNIQLQVGDLSHAAAIVDKRLTTVKDEANQRGAAAAVISALNQSLDSKTTWKVSGTLP